MKKWHVALLLVGATIWVERCSASRSRWRRRFSTRESLVRRTRRENVRVHEARTASVSASQAGPWSVRDRGNPALQPHTDTMADGSFSGDASGAPVPSGKRLVIEEVTANASIRSPQGLWFSSPLRPFRAPSIPCSLYYKPLTLVGDEFMGRDEFTGRPRWSTKGCSDLSRSGRDVAGDRAPVRRYHGWSCLHGRSRFRILLDA
jgi:hypothetical protein